MSRIAWKGFAILCALFAIAWPVYRAALTPEEARKRIATIPTVDWNTVVDDPAKKLTISWLPVPQFPAGRKEALGVRMLEDRFNVDIEPIFLDSAGYEHRKPLLFAGGEIPDVTWEGDPSDLRRDIYHGCLVPVPLDLIRKYAPVYYAITSRYAPMGWVYCRENGQNWGLPTIWMEGGPPNPGVWRKDWLERVGLHDAPQTLEEFHEALRRFTFNDPEGDGRKNTYGMSGDTISWHQMFPEFFGAFGVLPFGWMERNGRLVWGGVTPEAKAALQLLAGWYREGIIDPEMVTDGMNGHRIREKFANGRVGYASGLGSFHEFDHTSPEALVNLLHDMQPGAAMEPAVFPAGPGGIRGCRTWGTAANTLAFGPGVLKEPAKMIRILKMIEYQTAASGDTYLLYIYGKRGLHWDYRVPDTGAPGTGPSSGIRQLPPFDNKLVFSQELLTIWGMANPELDAQYQPASDKSYIQTWQNSRFAMLDAIGRPDLAASAQDYMADLRGLQLTAYSQIIRGEKPLSYFDDFCREWARRGGDRMTADAMETLRMKKEVFAELGIAEHQP